MHLIQYALDVDPQTKKVYRLSPTERTMGWKWNLNVKRSTKPFPGS